MATPRVGLVRTILMVVVATIATTGTATAQAPLLRPATFGSQPILQAPALALPVPPVRRTAGERVRLLGAGIGAIW